MYRQSDDVVPFKSMDARRGESQQAEVEAHWRGLMSGGQPPLRSDVRPKAFENALEYAFILEAVNPSFAKLRVAGCHLSDLLGHPAAGLPLTSFLELPSREEMGRALRVLFTEPAIVRISLLSHGEHSKPDVTGQLTLLPLRSDLGDVTRALGCLTTEGAIGRAGRRFEILDVRYENLPKPSLQRRPFTQKNLPKPLKVEHLKLVVSNS